MATTINVENKNFSLKNNEKALNVAKQLQEYILENDPLSDRAGIFKCITLHT